MSFPLSKISIFSKPIGLENLPKPVIGIIAGYLKIADRSHFARTCKRHLMFMPDKQDFDKLCKQKKGLVDFLLNSAEIYDIFICNTCHAPKPNINRCFGCDVMNCRDCCPKDFCNLCINEIKCGYPYCSNKASKTCYDCGEYRCSYHRTYILRELSECSNCIKSSNDKSFLKLHNKMINLLICIDEIKKHRSFNEMEMEELCLGCHKDYRMFGNYCVFCDGKVICNQCTKKAKNWCFHCEAAVCAEHLIEITESTYKCFKCDL